MEKKELEKKLENEKIISIFTFDGKKYIKSLNLKKFGYKYYELENEKMYKVENEEILNKIKEKQEFKNDGIIE